MGELDIILNASNSKIDVNKDINFNIELKQTHSTQHLCDFTETVSISEVFKLERDTISCYRFLGNINIVASNVLLNWDGDYSFKDIIEIRDFDDETQSYVFETDEILKEKDGWFYYLTGESCEKIYLEPFPDRFNMLDFSGSTNWDIWLTYPATTNVEDIKFNGVSISQGIAIYSGMTITIDDRDMTAFICPIKHGLNFNDEIIISSSTGTTVDGIYNIYRLGFGDGTFQSNVFIIDNVFNLPIDSIGDKLRFKRRFQGLESEYFSRWFSKITTSRDYEVYPTAFALNYYQDKLYSYNYNHDIDVNAYLDYLNRPLTEIYLTIIKKPDYNLTSGDTFWTNIESGINTAILGVNYDINKITSQDLTDSIESEVNSGNPFIFGDIVEYNKLQQRETVLEIAYHRFNSINRVESGFFEGYYYQPHHKMQIKQFSSYVVQKFSGDTDIVDYADFLDDGRAVWRDILPNNFNNGENIPFLNGCHYIYNNINLLLQRQNQCGLYDLGNLPIIENKCVLDNLSNLDEVEIDNICE